MGFRFKSNIQKLALVVTFLLIIFIVILILPIAKTYDSKEFNHFEHPTNFVMNDVGKSGVTGNGQWYLDEGRILIKINLTGIDNKALNPIHLRRGKCGERGAILVPLNKLNDGISETRIALDITGDIGKIKDNMNVSVLKSPTEPQTVISCGEIEGGFSGVKVHMEH